jgi:hypothetical protein
VLLFVNSGTDFGRQLGGYLGHPMSAAGVIGALTQDLVFVLAASFEITIDADFAASYDFGCHSFLLRGCDSINRGAEIAASDPTIPGDA